MGYNSKQAITASTLDAVTRLAMTELPPIVFQWTDEGVMKPLERFVCLCDKQLVVGESYRMTVEEERSVASHGHYFASVNEAWKNLPENIAKSFPTADKLRKWCLIKSGYAQEYDMVCETTIDAARFTKMIARMNDDAVVLKAGNVLKVYTPESQSMRSMNKERFQQSKEAVLNLLAEMIGTTIDELKENAGKAA